MRYGTTDRKIRTFATGVVAGALAAALNTFVYKMAGFLLCFCHVGKYLLNNFSFFNTTVKSRIYFVY